jgi:integrase
MKKNRLNLPKAQFHSTDYPGVLYLESAARTTGGKVEKTYYIRYRTPDGRQRFEKAVIPGTRMTAAKADAIRKDRSRGMELPNKDRRAAEKAAKEAEAGRWTFKRLWEEYKAGRPAMKRSATDESNFTNYLTAPFGDKEPKDVLPLDVDRLRLSLSKKKKPATVKNVLELIRRLSNFAEKKHLCAPLPFRVSLPKVNNLKTEDLTEAQLKRLLTVLRGEQMVKTVEGEKPFIPDPDAKDIMLLALYVGMRRSELFRLEWRDVDFRRSFITIREPKGGTDQTIPLPDDARELLKLRPRRDGSPYVFPGRGGRQKIDASKHFRAIRKAANLPKDFRPMHGLRHVFASMLASSGEVDLYTLQKLLTHKSATMTQRYAHLRDETLKKAANVAGRIIAATEQRAKKAEGAKE